MYIKICTICYLIKILNYKLYYHKYMYTIKLKINNDNSPLLAFYHQNKDKASVPS